MGAGAHHTSHVTHYSRHTLFTSQIVLRKPLGAMFGAYVFEGNQIVQVSLQRLLGTRSLQQRQKQPSCTASAPKTTTTDVIIITTTTTSPSSPSSSPPPPFQRLCSSNATLTVLLKPHLPAATGAPVMSYIVPYTLLITPRTPCSIRLDCDVPRTCSSVVRDV